MPRTGEDPHDPGRARRIEEARRAWEARVLQPALATARRSARRRSPPRGGAPVERLYSPADVAGRDYVSDLGFPGEFPYTRGVQPTMYRGRLWTMRQYAGFGTAAETNRRYRYLLEQGQTGLSVAFDLPTQMGYDADHPMARSEVGKVGVAISSLDDMRRPVRRHPARPGVDLDDDQRHRGDPARALHRGGDAAGRGRRTAVRARSRTTSSRSTSRAARTSSRPARRCG